MKKCHCGKKVHSRGLCSGHYSAWWRENNPQKTKEMHQAWYAKNREEKIEKSTEWNKNNPDKMRINNKRYIEKTDYYKKRYSNDENFRLRVILRNRLNQSIKSEQKVGSAVKDLGCSIEELKNHLESQFTEDMTWDNYGDWHIDHIKPLASFDLTNIEDLKKACHYTNLQPLWAEDNLKKSSKTP